VLCGAAQSQCNSRTVVLEDDEARLQKLHTRAFTVREVLITYCEGLATPSVMKALCTPAIALELARTMDPLERENRENMIESFDPVETPGLVLLSTQSGENVHTDMKQQFLHNLRRGGVVLAVRVCVCAVFPAPGAGSCCISCPRGRLVLHFLHTVLARAAFAAVVWCGVVCVCAAFAAVVWCGVACVCAAFAAVVWCGVVCVCAAFPAPGAGSCCISCPRGRLVLHFLHTVQARAAFAAVVSCVCAALMERASEGHMAFVQLSVHTMQTNIKAGQCPKKNMFDGDKWQQVFITFCVCVCVCVRVCSVRFHGVCVCVCVCLCVVCRLTSLQQAQIMAWSRVDRGMRRIDLPDEIRRFVAVGPLMDEFLSKFAQKHGNDRREKGRRGPSSE